MRANTGITFRTSSCEGAVLHRGTCAVVTRNCEDFIRSMLPVFTPEVWLAVLQADIG
jgi:hypothetical protein